MSAYYKNSVTNSSPNRPPAPLPPFSYPPPDVVPSRAFPSNHHTPPPPRPSFPPQHYSSFSRPPPNFYEPPPNFARPPSFPPANPIPPRYFSVPPPLADPPRNQSVLHSPHYVSVGNGGTPQKVGHNQSINAAAIPAKYNSHDCRHPKNKTVISYKKDQDWVNDLLKQYEDSKSVESSHQPHQDFTPRRLREVHENVAKYQQLLAQLKSNPDEDTLSATLEELTQSAKVLALPSYVAAVNKLVRRRRRQRERRRKRKITRKAEFQNKHKEIDALREISVKNEKQTVMQENLRREADSVLKEVRSKQAEAKSRLSLLTKLEDLRLHRLKRGAQQGFISSEHQNERFDVITKGLKDMLCSQLKEYELEERTLKAMLEQHNAEQGQSSISCKKEKFPKCEALREIYFGKSKPVDANLLASYTSADDSLEILINRRRLWDQFIREGEGSTIPVSWVLPSASTTQEWSKWIKP